MSTAALHHYDVQKLSCMRQQKKIFAELSFGLNPGQMLLVQGANGSGKSSLLRLLCGICIPAEGKIYWQGKDLMQIRSTFLQQVHYIGHENGNKLALSVKENLNLHLHLQQQTNMNSDSVLRQLKLDKEQDTLFAELSAGQKRRCALARLFLILKKIWILDEPLTSLDDETQALFRTRLQQHLQNGGLAIISTHQPVMVAQSNIIYLHLS